MEGNYTKVKEYLLDNIDTLKDVVRDINCWDGSLDYLDYQENDEEFFKTYFYNKPEEAVRAVCYGNYEYMDTYVHFNAYGNLDSCSEYEYEDELKSYINDIIERLIEEKDNIELNEELKELLEGEEK